MLYVPSPCLPLEFYSRMFIKVVPDGFGVAYMTGFEG